MKWLSKTSALTFALSAFISLGFGSCSMSAEEVCRNRIPGLKKNFQAAHDEVALLLPHQEQGRAIASIPDDSKLAANLFQTIELTRKEKDQWQEWSKERLVEAQRAIDYVKYRNEMRSAFIPLSTLANELVAFDGYVERGQILRMQDSLKKSLADADEAVRAVCGPVSEKAGEKP